MSTIYAHSVVSKTGEPVSMNTYAGQVLLIVNTASKCGFTPQLDGLQQLQDEFGERGLQVLAFPCNQFGRQEPGRNDQIQTFCQVNYGVTFPVFAKLDVNGNDAAPIYAFLKKEAKGLLGTEAIKWNFTKFLVDRKGAVVGRYGPAASPKSLRTKIEALL